MTLPTGNRPTSAGPDVHRRGFTLIELILVMAMLAVVLSVASPSLVRFFRGRDLDSEVRRFLSLTRYGQNRAVSEGIPMVLWIDEEQRAYGLLAESSYDTEYQVTTDEVTEGKDVRFDLAQDLQLEVELPVSNSLLMPWRKTTQLVGLLPNIRFTPDGFISETSPEYILFRQGDEDYTWIGRSRNRLNYEVLTNVLDRPQLTVGVR